MLFVISVSHLHFSFAFPFVPFLIILCIGTMFALTRLRRDGIHCISPPRVNVSGVVNLACFDKTGTLTEEGLDVMGVHACLPLEGRFFEFHNDPSTIVNQLIAVPEAFSARSEQVIQLIPKIDELSVSGGSDDEFEEEEPEEGRESRNSSPSRQIDMSDAVPVVFQDDFLRGMSTAHGITRVHGDLIGDPLDLKIFETLQSVPL